VTKCKAADHHLPQGSEANLTSAQGQFIQNGSKQRLEMLFDGRWTEHDAGILHRPLKFWTPSPMPRAKDARKKLGMNDAVITAEGH